MGSPQAWRFAEVSRTRKRRGIAHARDAEPVSKRMIMSAQERSTPESDERILVPAQQSGASRQLGTTHSTGVAARPDQHRWTPRSREAMEANHNTEVSNIRGPRAHARRLRSRINHVSSDSLTGPFVEGQFQSRSPRGLNLVRLKARDLHSPNSDAAVNGHKRVRPLLPANRSSDAPTLATSSGPEGRKQSGAHAPKRQVPRKGSNGEDQRSMDS